MQPDLTRILSPPGPVDLGDTLGPLRRGRGDPCLRSEGGGWWRATRTPAGVATGFLRPLEDGRLQLDAWGPGAEWLAGHAPVLTGGLDDPSDFRPRHPVLRALQLRHPGLRIARTEAVFEAAIATVLEQKVSGPEAGQGWRRMVWALGERAPGPHPGLWVAPAPELVARTPYHVFHAFGIERRRADTLRRVALTGGRLAETLTMSPAAARARLLAVPGLGPWSAAEIALVALGDADAVPVGDYHHPHMVAWALAGEARGSDERMLELLEPCRGHRGRALRLLLAGGLMAPRRGPRMALRDVARM